MWSVVQYHEAIHLECGKNSTLSSKTNEIPPLGFVISEEYCYQTRHVRGYVYVCLRLKDLVLDRLKSSLYLWLCDYIIHRALPPINIFT